MKPCDLSKRTREQQERTRSARIGESAGVDEMSHKVDVKSIGDARVHPIGIGTWGMGGARWPDGTVCADYDNDQREVEAIRYALSKGQNHIDTAQFYGATHTEELVGEAIRGFDRTKLFIASKVWKSHAKRSATPRAVEGMLARLGIGRLDLLYVHAPWDGIPMDEYVLGLSDAVAAGLADRIGVSNFSLQQLQQAVRICPTAISAVQIHYNLLERSVATEPLLRFCRSAGIAVVAYRPLERRLLTDPSRQPLLAELAERYAKTPAQIALAWLVGQEAVVPIPKASHRSHIDENLGALDVVLEAGDRLLLDKMQGERGT
jgi:diketogulonate reductase-like aldo/keto reductase